MSQSDLEKLPNIGKVVAEKLVDAGINTPEELRKTGAKNAFLKLRLRDPTACLSMLYGLEGAVEGIRWHSLSDEKKKQLKEFYQSL
ncbi:TfoX/Sxy family protein [Methanolapillus millepedarum]|uniref:TfoX C-terminal domain-containing protein n=1 Tax=Methanolapillus millepedarum TaxID=3028296 RepID=A0AA96V436_9EURY|nr:hypothetical protein MsAc7_18040 [Methanosarcinaceae archaeon Ac7]